MTMHDPDQLNARFGLPGALEFTVGPGDLPVARVTTPAARATVHLDGGQITEFQPTEVRPVLWLSPRSRFEPGKAIRGGIPVCWPWFGSHPADASLPAHGFARNRRWQVRHATVTPAGAELRLGLGPDASTRRSFPHAFDLELVLRIGRALACELRTRNTGTAPFAFTAALHSYLAVSDVRTITLDDLDGVAYLDTVGTPTWRVQRGPLQFGAEVDRIFLDAPGPVTVHDPGWGRTLRITRTGGRAFVVWNPAAGKASRLADLGAEHYPGFVCVEAAIAGGEVITLAPGAEHVLGTTIAPE